MLLLNKMKVLSAGLLLLMLTATMIHAETLSLSVRNNVFELLSLDCGMTGENKRFTDGITKLGVAITPLLSKILVRGLPEELEKDINTSVKKSYDERQKWLSSEDARIMDAATIKKLRSISFSEYSRRYKKNLQTRYQENVIRAYGLVGKPDAIKLIKNAIQQNPDLKLPGEKSILDIQQRFKLNNK